MDFAGGGSFSDKFFSDKAETLQICQSFSGKVGDAQFLKCPLPPSPPQLRGEMSTVILAG